jgi:hypothetical protein
MICSSLQIRGKMRNAAMLLIVFGIFSMTCSQEEVDPKIAKLDMVFTWPENQECFVGRFTGNTDGAIYGFEQSSDPVWPSGCMDTIFS